METKEVEPMTFDRALEKLKIFDYKSRIWNSNSHGELFHLQDYFLLAKTCVHGGAFRIWFEFQVKFAEENWKRPESIFQHILKLFSEEAFEHRKRKQETSPNEG